ncbi:unnamed protein product [Closterium sp. NIES-64]|nr:unnamed protein product [Closterium sp. NIES-64]
MAPRGLCHGCWDEGHAWQRCPHRPKGGIPAFSKRGGCGSNGKAKVADEEEQDDKAEAVVGEAVAAVGEEQPREGWWIDTGASHNFTPYASDFQRSSTVLCPPPSHQWRRGLARSRMWAWLGFGVAWGVSCCMVMSGKLDARAVMCVCVGVDMESKGWHMLDPSLMRIHIARDVDFLENVMWKDWDKAKGFGELPQDAAEISQLLPLPLSPPLATVDDAEMPSSSLPLAPLSVSVQQMPTPSAAAQWPLGHPEEIRYTGYFLFLLPGQRSVPLSTGAPPSPATTSPPPVTGLQMLGIQSGTGGEEVAGDAGVVEGMLCLAREVEGVALAGVSTGDVNEVLAQRYEMKDLVLRSTKTHSHARCTESTQRTKHINVPWHFVRDAVRQQEVEVHSVRSHLQDADMLTKALPSLQLHENLERIGMRVMAAKAKTSFGGGVVF